jgi:type IV secretory pathway VirJ component
MKIIAAALALVLFPWSAAMAQQPPALPKDTLVEYRTSGDASRDLAVILSGDGGWADLDRQLGGILAARGISVLGFDCMKYFWDTRSPDETARDIDAALTAYLKAWDKDRIVLIGFSFGAAVLPFVLDRMPAPLKSKIALAVMLGSNTYANWEIHWGDWLHDQPHKSARPVGPELAKVKDVRLLCVYGSEEKAASICPQLPKEAGEVLELPGGHHFDGNYNALASHILERVPR